MKEILRLHFEQKLGQRQIARAAPTDVKAPSTSIWRVSRPPLALTTRGTDGMRNSWRLLYFRPAKPPPKYSGVHRRISTLCASNWSNIRELTLELLWEEYREQHPDGYCYSRYVAAVFMLRDHLNAMTDARNGDVDAT